MNFTARSSTRLAVPLFVLVISALPVRADELQDIDRLLKQGQSAKALERVDQYLSQKPKDAKGRFIKGLILVEQNKAAEAIEVFTALSRDYPELPEPYNNLAVLYAAQGQYEKARQQLEMSIRTHPSYATAYENLGDVYTKRDPGKDGLVLVTFDQEYRSNNLSNTVKKRQYWLQEDGRWRIVYEGTV